jgi:predicted dehydrogenase
MMFCMRVSSGHEVGGVTEGELVSGGHGDGERTIRAAIVGSGNIAKAHIFALGKMGGRAEVVAAVDVDGARAEAFRAEHRIPRAYSDTAQMLEEEAPDLVTSAHPRSRTVP